MSGRLIELKRQASGHALPARLFGARSRKHDQIARHLGTIGVARRCRNAAVAAAATRGDTNLGNSRATLSEKRHRWPSSHARSSSVLVAVAATCRARRTVLQVLRHQRLELLRNGRRRRIRRSLPLRHAPAKSLKFARSTHQTQPSLTLSSGQPFCSRWRRLTDGEGERSVGAGGGACVTDRPTSERATHAPAFQ